MPPWRRLLTFVVFWGRMTQKSPSLQGTNCIDMYCSHWPLLSISEGWHHPFLILGAVETLGPWEERDPTSRLQVWPLQIFKTLEWSNVCLAGSVSPSCRFALFWPGFNALIQTVEVICRPGTRHNSKSSLYGSCWQTDAAPKSSKNHLEASFGWTAKVQELSACQWHRGLQRSKAEQPDRHSAMPAQHAPCMTPPL